MIIMREANKENKAISPTGITISCRAFYCTLRL
nr:MAG TPA: hypothetical protein [Caudoviricetes sp.]